MKKIKFITANNGKVKSLANRLSPEKYELTQTALDLPELQAGSASEVSLAKAREAFKLINEPLIVQDGSFHVVALEGFPGVYIKYMQETIGPEGLLKLMEGIEDRRCYFEGALTYIDEGTTKTFVKKGGYGTLTHAVDNTNSEKAWSDIWKVFVPEGFDKTLAAIPKDELDAQEKRTTSNSEFAQFVRWLESE